MERPPDNEEPVEGRIFRFPRLWVPPDGIEPLHDSRELGVDADPRTSSATTPTRSDRQAADSGDEGAPRSGFEAAEFWERGDTQEFVGVSSQPDRSTRTSDETLPVTSKPDSEAQQPGTDSLGTALESGTPLCWQQ